MQVLYIGGTGEISYACVQAGAAMGQRITVFNRGRNDEPLPPGVERITGDASDPAAYAQLGERTWDVVCQFMAFRPEQVERDIALFSGKCGQYVFISTAMTYLKPPDRLVVTEDMPQGNPFSVGYAQNKAAMEKILWRADAAGGPARLPVTIVRPSHTYRRHFPGTLCGGDLVAWRIRHGRPIIVHGDGTSVWTMTHAEDFAFAFVRLLGHPRALGQAFHITHERGMMWNHIFQAVGSALGIEPKLVHVSSDALVRFQPAWAERLYGDMTWSVLFDNRKVRGVVGPWACKVDIPQGMARVASEHYGKRAGSFVPDEAENAMLDRLAREHGVPAA